MEEVFSQRDDTPGNTGRDLSTKPRKWMSRLYHSSIWTGAPTRRHISGGRLCGREWTLPTPDLYQRQPDAQQEALLPRLDLVPLGVFKTTGVLPLRGLLRRAGDAHTCTGAVATAGHTIAVDPRVIPYGSKVMINVVVYTAGGPRRSCQRESHRHLLQHPCRDTPARHPERRGLSQGHRTMTI